MSLKEIVNVSITKETKTVSRKGFGTPLILGSNLNSSNRIEFFTDISSLALKLTGGINADEYKSAVDLMSQQPSVVKFAVGQIQGEKIITDDSGTYTAGDIVATVNGTEITESYDTDKDTTLGNLASSIQALSDVSTAVYSSVTHTITITPTPTAVLSVVLDTSSVVGNITMVLSSNATETVTNALNNIQLENDDWYGLCAITRVKADQLLIAEWTETQQKICVLASDEDDIFNIADSSDTTSLSAVCKANAYSRTIIVALLNASAQYPDSALLGKILPLTVGSYTAMFKTLNSISSDNLTNTQSNNVRDKYSNTYERVGGVNIIKEGQVCSGDYIDEIILIDWVVARLQESIYSLLVKVLKVPYDEQGLTMVESSMTPVFKEGQDNSGITQYHEDENKIQDGGFNIRMPDISSISSIDKANRFLDNVEFTFWIAGAIHKIQINGVATL